MGLHWKHSIDTFAEKVSGGRWVAYPWLCYILRHVRYAIARGGARIIINAPPRHGKSEAISHWLPVWYLHYRPQDSIILASYGDRYAETWGRKVRDTIEEHCRKWVTIRGDRNSASDWLTTKGGGMRCAGAGGSLTGRGGHLLVIDDPHKDWIEATSETTLERIIDWYYSVFYTRAEPGASIVIIQTRWTPNDLTGHLLGAKTEPWDLIKLPALAEVDDPLGRAVDDALCPQRYPEDELRRMRSVHAARGSRTFEGMYQQRPSPPGGNMVKRSMVGYWHELPDDLHSWIQVWDCTFGTTGNSYVVGQTWARNRSKFFLIDQYRGKIDFIATLKQVRRAREKWPLVRSVHVEKAANGYAVVRSLQDEMPGITDYSVKGKSKEERLFEVLDLFGTNSVLIPDPAKHHWVREYESELLSFPSSVTDDQVDCTSMALDILWTRRANLNMIIPIEESSDHWMIT